MAYLQYFTSMEFLQHRMQNERHVKSGYRINDCGRTGELCYAIVAVLTNVDLNLKKDIVIDRLNK